ncbi:MAG TPA: 23S rRNA (uracil(1939)-C(5))-methyltransferase RlmD [Leptospiraceae bacterium]|nr:23S rRNA (uracil(1939)-C(5))-methyltransferase RlmD [Leptospiraceae bacterium]HMW04861.1 23S rRNA (uracil(1939)-C(5))-methyltransferase RlmD [Leptospiraceae bacterium]HMY30391.1 23S rRNA (uracil(1939)-C(5))-methyltransferase RlmD [Leptospiraceae bacterium]HMZ66823.1 23S rRNA (uracil(1939)-C(5))-methyltransferase RlmD [Leptospiraceae bacterium]HNA07076.1 23S rRNA (uracil(1939)-C(5))-methyltransferase RlmD [Leptospiraceae bacterium]
MKKDCIHFGECAGCDILDYEYKSQLKEKKEEISRLFSDFKNTEILDTFPSPKEFYYRNKVQLPFGRKKGKYEEILTLGLHARDYSKIIDLKECKIQNETLSDIAWIIRDWAREENYSGYNEKKETGFLKYLLLKKSNFSKEILIGLITGSPREFKKISIDKLIEKIKTMLEEKYKNENITIAGILQNINLNNTSMVLGEQERLLWGKRYIKEEISGFKYRVGLSTFIQVNPYQTPRLYNEILKNIPEGVNAIDAYCGIGTISLLIAKKAKSVLAIESNPHSIDSAKIALKENKVNNVKFLLGDTAKILSKLDGQFDLLVVDPPRAGLDRRCISSIFKLDLSKIIYVSCNPDTLLEDAKYLSEKYILKKITPVDMFPQTFHIESVALFERRR